MKDSLRETRYRFGLFELDAAAGELRRRGTPVKLNAQPLLVLCLLVERAGQVVTRAEIAERLWPEGTFVDYEHGVNAAVNRIREALGDTARDPGFVQTLARRGYRFVAPVVRVEEAAAQTAELDAAVRDHEEAVLPVRLLATVDDLPKTPARVVRTLFMLFQWMYLGFYVGALANLEEIEGLLAPLPGWMHLSTGVAMSAAALIPVRAFVLCAVLFRAPRATEKVLRMWPALLVCDLAWALSPLLLLHHINAGLAVACGALLAYAPFAQRSLVLMGAAGERAQAV